MLMIALYSTIALYCLVCYFILFLRVLQDAAGLMEILEGPGDAVLLFFACLLFPLIFPIYLYNWIRWG